MLSLLSLDNVHVIPWNFPHGIAWGAGNKFCQVGALNHFNRRFGRDAILFNFDIDELLVCKDSLVQQKINQGKTLRFDSFNLPFDPSLSQPYSFVDFKYKNKQPRKRAYKYTTRCEKNKMFNVHAVNDYGFLPKFIVKIIPEGLKSGPVVPVDKAYFLHHLGITTNWKAHYSDKLAREVPLKPERLAKDESARNIFLQMSRRAVNEQSE